MWRGEVNAASSCRAGSVPSRLEGHHHIPHPVPALHLGLAGSAGAHPALCAALLLQVGAELPELKPFLYLLIKSACRDLQTLVVL